MGIGTSKKLSVLYVEDDPDTRDMLAVVLRREGYEVTTSANADEGLRCLQEQNYHLVISDYALPCETGLGMLREAKQLGLLGTTGVLLCTAYHLPEEMDGFPVLKKTLDLRVFLSKVREALTLVRSQEFV